MRVCYQSLPASAGNKLYEKGGVAKQWLSEMPYLVKKNLEKYSFSFFANFPIANVHPSPFLFTFPLFCIVHSRHQKAHPFMAVRYYGTTTNGES